MEHPFGIIKRQFGCTKIRYVGLAQNTHRLLVLCAEQPGDGQTGSIEKKSVETAGYMRLKIGKWWGLSRILPISPALPVFGIAEIQDLQKSPFPNSIIQTFPKHSSIQENQIAPSPRLRSQSDNFQTVKNLTWTDGWAAF